MKRVLMLALGLCLLLCGCGNMQSAKEEKRLSLWEVDTFNKEKEKDFFLMTVFTGKFNKASGESGKIAGFFKCWYGPSSPGNALAIIKFQLYERGDDRSDAGRNCVLSYTIDQMQYKVQCHGYDDGDVMLSGEAFQEEALQKFEFALREGKTISCVLNILDTGAEYRFIIDGYGFKEAGQRIPQ